MTFDLVLRFPSWEWRLYLVVSWAGHGELLVNYVMGHSRLICWSFVWEYHFEWNAKKSCFKKKSHLFTHVNKGLHRLIFINCLHEFDKTLFYSIVI